MRLKNYPPGPFPLPIIGNMHLIMFGKSNETMRDLAKIYGDVFSLSFGMSRVVMVDGYHGASKRSINYKISPVCWPTK